MTNNYTVYSHRNLINGKLYFGITSQQPEIRWKNGFGYSYNRHFFNAINKYGWENFEHKILFSGLTKEAAVLFEAGLIAQFNTTNPKLGYNLAKKGTSNGTSHSGKHTEEAKAKISQSRTGRTLSLDAYNRLVATHQSFLPAKKVYQISFDGTKQLNEFKSVQAAKRYLNNRGTRATAQNISQAASGKQKTAYGYTWSFTPLTKTTWTPEELGISYERILEEIA